MFYNKIKTAIDYEISGKSFQRSIQNELRIPIRGSLIRALGMEMEDWREMS